MAFLIKQLILFLILLSSYNGAQTLDVVGVFLESYTINNITLVTFYARTKTTIPAQGQIEIFYPSQTIAQIGETCTLSLSTLNKNIAISCAFGQISPNAQLKVTMTSTTDAIPAGTYLQLAVTNFKNPSSTTQTSTFTFATKDSAGNVLDQALSNITIKATADVFRNSSLASSSNTIGYLTSTLTLQFQIKNAITSDSKIYLTFPYWNPQADTADLIHMVNSVTPICNGNTTFSGTLTCTYNPNTLMLTISNAFQGRFGSTLKAGNIYYFTINSVRNPISQQQIGPFILQTGDNSQGLIDQSSLYLKVSNIAQITGASIQLDNTLVQASTTYTLQFNIPVPLNSGCQIIIQFPQLIDLEIQTPTVEGFLFFGAKHTLSGTYTSQNYYIANGCPTYMPNDNAAFIIFSNIINPFFTTTTSDSFEIYIYDSSNQAICNYKVGDLKITTTNGGINIGNIVSNSTQINSNGGLLFSLQPLQGLYSDSQLVITVPYNFTLPTLCQLTDLTLISSNAVCTISGQIVTISNCFNQQYSYSSTQFIKFRINNIKMPPSIAPTVTFYFTFSTKYGSDYQLVDSGSKSNLLTATEGLLVIASITPSNYKVNEVSSYKIQFKISNPILQNGFIVVNIPPELTLTNLTISPLCSGFSSQFSIGVTCSSPTLRQVIVKNGFINGNYSDANTFLSFFINGIQNPRSMQTTSNFQIFTQDSATYTIDSKTYSLAVIMNQAAPILSASVTPNSFIVGASTSYIFKLSSPFILYPGDIILLQFPVGDLNLPISQTFKSCQGVSYLSQTLVCKLYGQNGLQVFVSLNGNNNQIVAKTSFSFQVNGIQNPPSTKPTSMFSAAIYDSSFATINIMNTLLTSFTVQMLTTASFTFISVMHQSQQALKSTSYTFTIQLAHTLPLGGIIVITYPTQLKIDSNSFGCSIDFQQSSLPNCEYSTITGNYNITMKNVADIDIVGGTIIKLTINGLINSKYASTTDSFKVTTMTSDGFYIDAVSSGLTVTNDCDYPCFTCNQQTPSQCLSCDSTSIYSLLQNSQCLTSCPYGYYQKSSFCYICDKECLSCSGGPSNCPNCKQGYYFLNNQCLDSCPQKGYFQNSNNGMCELCESPCYTCQGSTSTCTSCISTVKQNLFFENQCYDTCPASVSVNENGVCSHCSTNCKTCKDLPTVCTSCDSQLKLDMFSMTCVSNCPQGTTVDKGSYCDLCDQTCKTCASTDTDYCLTCQYGLLLDQVNNQCVTDCPIGTTHISQSGTSTQQKEVCSKCANGCLECEKDLNYCTKCDNNKVFYNYTCIDSCPFGYALLNSTLNVCISEGLVCPFGYSFDQFGVCKLGVAECQKGYTLNRTRDKCIPKPVFYFPFLFLILSIAWIIFILKRAKKTQIPLETVISQLLIGLITLQTISYIIMFFLAIALQYQLIFSLHMVCIVGMYLTNLSFSLYFDIKLKIQDSAFIHWSQLYPKIITIYTLVAALFNFKLYRGLYSNILPKKEYFSAVYEDRYSNLVRPIFIATLINLVIQVIPALIVDVYTLIFIPWGYQIMTMSIDNIIIALVIFALEIWEFRIHKLQNSDLGDSKYLMDYKKVKKQHEQSNVLGGMFDDESRINLKNGQDISLLDTLTKDMMNHKIRQTESETEARLLQNIIKKLGEEQKFNEMQSDDDTANQPQNNNKKNKLNKSLEYANEQLTLRSQKEKMNPHSSKAKKLKIEEIRERIENKLLGRQIQQQQYNQAQIRDEEARIKSILLMGIEEENINLEEHIQQQQQQQQQNLESARTEKYNYNNMQGGQQQTKDQSLQYNNNENQVEENQEIKKNIEDYNNFFEEYKEALEQDNLEKALYERNWQSFDEDVLRDPYDEMELESDFGDANSNQSFPFRSNILNKDPEEQARIDLFRERLKSHQQYNNVYAERFNKYQQKQDHVHATRRTQTYERAAQNTDELFDNYDKLAQELEEEQQMELDQDLTRDLIQIVIGALSNSDLSSNMRDGSSDGYYDNQSNQDNSGRKNNKKKRKREIKFEMDDIVGAFDIDDFGNIVLNKETMRDNFNRPVNKHGYLVDQMGNIIDQNGQIIFEAEELDKDGDIPLPYRFEQRKKLLLRSQDKFTIDPETQQRNYEEETLLLQEEDQKVEDELQRLKSLSKHSSVDSLIGESPNKLDYQNFISDDEDNNNLDDSKSKKSNKFSKRERALAKAYGGNPLRPPLQNQKSKKRKQKMSEDKKLERKLTDKIFPSLFQEEDRVRKLQALTDQMIPKSSREQYQQQHQLQQQLQQQQQEEEVDEQQFDLEQYFRNQMSEMQQFRDNDREEIKLQLGGGEQQQQQQQYYEQNQESATTTRSMFNPMGNGIGGDFGSISNPLQELLQYDELSLDKQKMPQLPNKFNSITKNAIIAQNNNNNTTSQIQEQLKKKLFYQQNSTLNASSGADDLSPFQQNRVETNFTNQNISSTVQNANQFLTNTAQDKEKKRKFDYYLPDKSGQTTAKLKNKYKKQTDLQKRDNSLSNAGQFTVYGDQKLKEMENIYLKKFQSNHTQQRVDSGGVMNIQNNSFQVVPQRTQSQMRQQDMQPIRGRDARFRDLKHNVDETDSIGGGVGIGTKIQTQGNNNGADFNSLGAPSENDDFQTVFQGMQKAMHKIEELRHQERQKGVRVQKTMNNSSSLVTKNRLNVQNNNWV